MRGRPWTTTEVDTLITLRRQGKSYDAIGKELTRRGPAVAEKANQLRKEGHDLPVVVDPRFFTSGRGLVDSASNDGSVPASSTSFDINDWSLTGRILGDPHPSRSALGRRF